MICPNCNRKIPDESKMCMKCGFLIVEEKEEVIGPSRSYKRMFHKHLLLIVILIIVLLSFLGVCVKNIIIEQRITDIEELVVDKNSIHYVNDLYISDGRHYKYLLNDEEKEIYKTFITKIKNFETDFSIDLSEKQYKYFYNSVQYFDKVISALLMDHPELIQYGSVTLTPIDYSKGLKVGIRYALDEKQTALALKDIQNTINSLKKVTKDMSEVEKVKYVYDYIADNNSYGDKTNPISQSAYSVFNANYSPVCAGYARASQIIFQNLGINSILVEGKIDNEGHEWNFVKIDGEYYWYDVTQSDGDKYRGYLFSDKSGYDISYKELIPPIKGKIHLYKTSEN